MIPMKFTPGHPKCQCGLIPSPLTWCNLGWTVPFRCSGPSLNTRLSHTWPIEVDHNFPMLILLTKICPVHWASDERSTIFVTDLLKHDSARDQLADMWTLFMELEHILVRDWFILCNRFAADDQRLQNLMQVCRDHFGKRVRVEDTPLRSIQSLLVHRSRRQSNSSTFTAKDGDLIMLPRLSLGCRTFSIEYGPHLYCSLSVERAPCPVFWILPANGIRRTKGKWTNPFFRRYSSRCSPNWFREQRNCNWRKAKTNSSKSSKGKQVGLISGFFPR